jgi:hypothetical protein
MDLFLRFSNALEPRTSKLFRRSKVQPNSWNAVGSLLINRITDRIATRRLPSIVMDIPLEHRSVMAVMTMMMMMIVMMTVVVVVVMMTMIMLMR